MTLIDPTLITSWMNSPYALGVLSILSFSESAFFIIPPEVMLIPMGLNNQSLAIWYGVIASLTSVAGAAFGYWIGQKGGKPVLKKLFKDHHIKAVKKMFQKYDTKAIFISAFTPIPFKVFTLSAGVFDLNFKRFMVTALLGRGARYLLLSALIVLFGDTISNFLENQLDKFIAVGTIGLIGLVGFYKIGIPFLETRVLKFSLKDRFLRIFRKR